MLERPEPPGEGAGPSPPPLPPSRPAEAAPAHPLIEDYLDQVCAPLTGVVPYARRQELRAECRAHILALREAYRELGSDPDEAVLQAMRQFGDPHRLGRRWRCEWERSGARPWLSSTLPRGARRLLSATCLYSVALVLASMQGWVPSPFEPGNFVTALTIPSMPLSAGLLACLLARFRPQLRTLCSLALLIPLAAGAVTLVGLPQEEAWMAIAGMQCTFWGLGGVAGLLDGLWQDYRKSTRWLPALE